MGNNSGLQRDRGARIMEVAADSVMATMVVGVVLDAVAVAICGRPSIAVSWWFFWMSGCMAVMHV